MKKENKKENIWTREFNPSIDIIIKYIKIIAKYIYDKILTRWGIFLISLVGFGYIMINIYIYIYLDSFYPNSELINEAVQFKRYVVCSDSSLCLRIIKSITNLSYIFIPIFLYSTIFLFYKNKEKFEKWKRLTVKYLLWYILIGYVASKYGGNSTTYSISAADILSILGPIFYFVYLVGVFSRKLSTFLIVLVISLIIWRINSW